MQFKSGSTLPHPPTSKTSHSSDSLTYLSWLQDKLNHQQSESIQDTSQNYLPIPSTTKKPSLNYDCSVDHHHTLGSQGIIEGKYGQEAGGKRKEYQRTEDKGKKGWDDGNSSAIAAAMRCLREKNEELRARLEGVEEQNRRLRREREGYESPKKVGSAIALEEELSPIKAKESHYAERIKDYELQLEHKTTIILELTRLIQQDNKSPPHPTKPTHTKPDQILYIEKINLLQLQLQQLRSRSQKDKTAPKCDCAKLTIKYSKLLERLSAEEGRSALYLKESKQAQKAIESWRGVMKELQLAITRLPESARAQLKKITSRMQDLTRSSKSRSKQHSKQPPKSLHLTKSSRTLSKPKSKQPLDLLSSSRNDTHRGAKLHESSSNPKKISTETSRKSKERKFGCTQIPKQSKVVIVEKDRKRGLRQQIAELEGKIVDIKAEYKMLAGSIQEESEEYEVVRARLNGIALLLQRKTEELFDKRSMLNDDVL